jgi:sulfopyruvate decarboxylase TPP-binding subunit
MPATLSMTKGILNEFQKCGITHAIGLSDSCLKTIFDLLLQQHEITLVSVCREGEAIAIAHGLMIGGKEPVVLHQNSGFFESGDSVRSIALDYGLPLLMVLGYRGWKRENRDSAAVWIEPILDAWSIKHYLVETDADVWKISMAHKEAHETNKPVAILIV